MLTTRKEKKKSGISVASYDSKENVYQTIPQIPPFLSPMPDDLLSFYHFHSNVEH
jgi:hypothetical protein